MTSMHRSALMLASTVLMGVITAGGCMATSDPTEDVDAIDTSGLSFEEWVDTVYQEPDTGVYIVNGDTPITSMRELQEFFMVYVQQGALIVHQAGGVDAKWDDTQKLNISYCVSNTFGNNYQATVTAMEAAAGAWEAVANVNFVHVSALDANCTSGTSEVVFDVNPVSGQPYLARAFFPNQTRPTRNVLIDSTAFGNIPPWTLAGILRHELGHTLGFRHEHTRPEAGTCFEDNNYRPLTDYDSNSVMHYPQCNGTQKGDLVLTDKDAAGAATLYGAPGQQPPPDPGQPPGACAHTSCETGVKLDAACDACVGQVCAADAYCCTTKWDSICVGEVASVCGQATCQAQPASCIHDVCAVGGKLDAGCDDCVSKICAGDAFCCNNQWDTVCVAQVQTVCGVSSCKQ